MRAAFVYDEYRFDRYSSPPPRPLPVSLTDYKISYRLTELRVIEHIKCVFAKSGTYEHAFDFMYQGLARAT